MREILSKNNELVKSDAKLLTKKARDAQGLFILEGIKLISEAKAEGYEVIRVYVDSNDLEKYQEVLNTYSEMDIISTKAEVMEKLTDAKSNQGIIGIAKKLVKTRQNPQGLSLILENLQDPKNVGALLRTAAATNFVDVYLINSADPYSAKSVRSSMSGLFKVNLYQMELEEVLLKLSHCEILCGDMDGIDIFKCDLPSYNIAIAVGNEGNGVSDNLVKGATKTVSIPMENGLESLNVAISGSILMYETRRKQSL